MKPSEEHLREYIRDILRESIDPEQKLMILESTGIPKILVLAKWSNSPPADLNAFAEHNVLAAIRLEKPRRSPCAGALAINIYGAEHGWSSKLFELAMEFSPNGIIGPRDFDDPPVRNLLYYFLKNRSDIQPVLLHNIDDYGMSEPSDPSFACKGGGDADTWGSYHGGKRHITKKPRNWDVVEPVKRGKKRYQKWVDDPYAYAFNKSSSEQNQLLKVLGAEYVEKHSITDSVLSRIADLKYTQKTGTPIYR